MDCDKQSDDAWKAEMEQDMESVKIYSADRDSAIVAMRQVRSILRVRKSTY